MKNFLITLTILLIVAFSAYSVKASEINGYVLYQGNTSLPVNNVVVTLKNVSTNSVLSYTTSANGFYAFSNVVNGNYILTASTSVAGGGVSFYDAALVFLHMLGVYQFTPIQFLASDVNDSNTITWSDYTLIINNLIYGTPFPVGPWKFESKSFTVSGFKDGVPTGLGGTCSGDVEGGFIPTANNTPALPIAMAGSLYIAENEPFTFNIVTNNEFSITGAGIVVNYPSDLLQIKSVEFKGVDCEYNIEGGQIRLVWGNPNTSSINFVSGESFVTIHGISTSAFKKGMAAEISLDGSTSLLNSSNKEVTELSFEAPAIEYGNQSIKLTNFPNPFTASTKLSIYTPQTGDVTIKVFSATGNLIKNIPLGKMVAGYHEVDLDATDMAKGYYICSIHLLTNTEEQSKTVRIVKAG